MAIVVNDCYVTEVPATFERDVYWVVNHIRDGDVGRAANRAQAIDLARAYVPNH